tara:strand:- start:47982 stop:49643 length:1662 start_codon:yes stop_codon:yes gene_type:complete
MFASVFRSSQGGHVSRGVGLHKILTACLLALCLSFTAQNAEAKQRKKGSFTPKAASFVMDAHTGKVLYARNADLQCYPASLTKVMTLYMLFEQLERNKISLNTKIKVSRHAANQAPSRLGLKPGSTIRVEDAILALVTKSANDVAAAVGEHIGGTESNFARMMTNRAKTLGMNHTQYRNASGLPNSAQLTTARDQATLAKRIRIDFPRYYRYFATKTFAWDGRVFKNHNHLLGKYEGVNGLKTGYTAASGFNLTTTVSRDGKSVIGVVLGGKTARARDQHMVAILDQNMPRALALNSTGAVTTRLASNEPAPTPILRPNSDELDALVAAIDTPDPDEETYTGTEQVASFTAPVPLRPVQDAAPAKVEPVKLASAAPALRTTSSAAPLDTATAYALAALGKAEGPVRRVGRDLGDMIVSPANANEGTQATSPVGLRTAVNEGRATTSRGWSASDPLIPDGTWVIQIGAYSDQGDAVSRIRDAIKAAPNELGNAVPVTIPVRSADNRMLYRSRFGGFDDEKEARNACGRLAREKISCIAIPPANWAMPGGAKARG